MCSAMHVFSAVFKAHSNYRGAYQIVKDLWIFQSSNYKQTPWPQTQSRLWLLSSPSSPVSPSCVDLCTDHIMLLYPTFSLSFFRGCLLKDPQDPLAKQWVSHSPTLLPAFHRRRTAKVGKHGIVERASARLPVKLLLLQKVIMGICSWMGFCCLHVCHNELNKATQWQLCHKAISFQSPNSILFGQLCVTN